MLMEREFVRMHENVFKVGRTGDLLHRFSNYPKGSSLIAWCAASDALATERAILKELSARFIRRRDVGLEYFEGPPHEVRNVFIATVLAAGEPAWPGRPSLPAAPAVVEEEVIADPLDYNDDTQMAPPSSVHHTESPDSADDVSAQSEERDDDVALSNEEPPTTVGKTSSKIDIVKCVYEFVTENKVILTGQVFCVVELHDWFSKWCKEHDPPFPSTDIPMKKLCTAFGECGAKWQKEQLSPPTLKFPEKASNCRVPVITTSSVEIFNRFQEWLDEVTDDGAQRYKLENDLTLLKFGIRLSRLMYSKRNPTGLMNISKKRMQAGVLYTFDVEGLKEEFMLEQILKKTAPP